MLFLYGRDIFASSVIKAKEFKENEIVFVCNEDDDVLGIGKSRFDSERISFIDPDRVVIENLTDRGQYLRKKKLYSSF
jgi:60S ribosome subunit biogenesis protein NIP7